MKAAALAPQATAVVGHSTSFRSPYPLRPAMPGLRGSLLSRLVEFGARFYIVELVGGCLAPALTDRFAIYDKRGDIRLGDVFIFSVRDWHQAFGHFAGVGGVAKRFRGVNYEAQILECECTNPPWVIHTGLTNLLCAHRIVATAPTWWSAIKLLWRVRLNPAAFDAPLMPGGI